MVTKNSERPIQQNDEVKHQASQVVCDEIVAQQTSAMRASTAHRRPDLSEVVPPTLVVSLDDAAAMLGTCKRTIERERDRGTLKCLRIGRHWKVRVGEIHAYLRRMESESR